MMYEGRSTTIVRFSLVPGGEVAFVSRAIEHSSFSISPKAVFSSLYKIDKMLWSVVLLLKRRSCC